MAKSVDYYKLLGISIFASEEEIRNGYLSKIKEYHPDTYKGNKREAENITANLNLAYSVLKNKDKKFVYDKQYGFDKMREEALAEKARQEKAQQKREKKAQKKNIDPNTGDYAFEKQKEKYTAKEAKEPQKHKKIKTNFFTKEPKKDVKKVKRSVLTPEQKSLRKERIILDTVIISLLIIVILLLIFNWKQKTNLDKFANHRFVFFV